MWEYHRKSWLVPTLPTSSGESRVARRNGEMISPRFPHLASLLASLMERILTDALLLLVLDGARRRKPVTKHKVVPSDDTRI